MTSDNLSRAWVEESIGEHVDDAALVYAADGRTTYRIRARSGQIFFVKVAPALGAEHDRLAWLAGKLPVPAVEGFRHGDELDWLLTSGLPGEDLTSDRHRAEPDRVVRMLAATLRRIHSLDPVECPFHGDTADGVVIHGDACLPNFLIEGERLTGVVDVGDCRVASPTIDLEAAVWSLRHNLGDGWGSPFLTAYGWPNSDERTAESLAAAYERRR